MDEDLGDILKDSVGRPEGHLVDHGARQGRVDAGPSMAQQGYAMQKWYGEARKEAPWHAVGSAGR